MHHRNISYSVINVALGDAQTVFAAKEKLIEIVATLKKISESAQMAQLAELLA